MRAFFCYYSIQRHKQRTAIQNLCKHADKRQHVRHIHFMHYIYVDGTDAFDAKAMATAACRFNVMYSLSMKCWIARSQVCVCVAVYRCALPARETTSKDNLWHMHTLLYYIVNKI